MTAALWILRNDKKKLTNFGASLATANLGQKVVKAKLLFPGSLVEHELPLTTANHTAKLFRNMLPDSREQIQVWSHENNTYVSWSSLKSKLPAT